MVGSTFAQVGHEGELGYIGDEPNTEAGALPYANSPSDHEVTDYPADDNNVEVALTGEPAIVLSARWYSRDTGSQIPLDSGRLLGKLLGRGGMMVPGTGQFLAWHGEWADLTRDGWLDDPAMGTASYLFGPDFGVYVETNSERDCYTTEPATTCDRPDEWLGINTATIVGYITPHVPTQVLVTNTFGDTQGRSPDLPFKNLATGEGGRYFATASNFDLVMVDEGVLMTVVTEIFNDPVISPDGPRGLVASPGSLVDVDLYPSLSSDLEALYQEHVLETLASNGIEPDHPEAILPTPDASAGDSVVGPAVAPHRPALPPDGNGFDYASGPHVYFDVRLEVAGWICILVCDDVGLGSLSHTPGGAAQAPAYAGVYGNLGAWHDKNGDGFIGAPAASEGCEDAYDCGATQDPNVYGDASEFSPGCYKGHRDNGEVNAVLSSSTGSWGAGVYVFRDEIGYEIDGRAAFFWFFDTALDPFDGSVDQLVTSGPIDFRLVCADGAYNSFEHFVFLASNAGAAGDPGFDVIVTTEPITPDFTKAGVVIPETVSDTHTTSAWTV